MWPFKRKPNPTREIEIARVEIDGQGRLDVWPAAGDFEHVYRQAMEVHWDRDRRCLFSPVPREMSHGQWFAQIVQAVRNEFGQTLVTTDRTLWGGVDDELRLEMSALRPAKHFESGHTASTGPATRRTL